MYKKPVIIYNYPKKIKPFYARVNDDGKTVAAFDVVVPKVRGKDMVNPSMFLQNFKLIWVLACNDRPLCLQARTLIRGSQNEERISMLSTRLCLPYILNLRCEISIIGSMN